MKCSRAGAGGVREVLAPVRPAGGHEANPRRGERVRARGLRGPASLDPEQHPQ